MSINFLRIGKKLESKIMHHLYTYVHRLYLSLKRPTSYCVTSMQYVAQLSIPRGPSISVDWHQISYRRSFVTKIRFGISNLTNILSSLFYCSLWPLCASHSLELMCKLSNARVKIKESSIMNKHHFRSFAGGLEYKNSPVY